MNRKKDRCGYTLIELVLVVSVTTVILGINVGWIHQTMKFALATKQRQQHHQALTRLGWELRDDVRTSQSISMKGENQLGLSMADGLLVTYTILDTELLVEKRNAQNPVKRETFSMDPGSTAVWDTSEMPDWITLKVFRGGKNASAQPAEIAGSAPVEATVTAVDLHVRVRPNRWAGKKTSLTRKTDRNGEQE